MPEQNTRPLAAIESLESAAFRVGQVARHLLAEHPDAGLTVKSADVFGYEDNVGAATLYLSARSVDTARTVAAALGIEVRTEMRRCSPYAVFESVDGHGAVDGIEVRLMALRHLTDDEAAAWRTNQGQVVEGGDS